MKEKVGEVFSIASDNPPVPGCTISKPVYNGGNDIIYFSLARNTDISAEIFPYYKLLIVASGSMEVYGADCVFLMYDDDGDGYGYEERCGSDAVRIHWDDANRRLTSATRCPVEVIGHPELDGETVYGD